MIRNLNHHALCEREEKLLQQLFRQFGKILEIFNVKLYIDKQSHHDCGTYIYQDNGETRGKIHFNKMINHIKF